MMRSGAYLAFNRQATAFDTVGNIYAPYYRQADAATCLSATEEDKDKLLRGTPESDVIAAFDYYIKNYNDGRPFILAGHSQGSNMLLYLLSDYMKEHPEVYKRMVAAYVIGYSVTEDYLAQNPHLKFAEGASDTGVIISYNTQGGATGGKNPVILDGALVINPITWTRSGITADALENLGSILLNPDGSVILNENGEFKQVMGFADATVDSENGALICSTVDVDTWAPGNPVFPKGVFHSFDYPFYYYNIRGTRRKERKCFSAIKPQGARKTARVSSSANNNYIREAPLQGCLCFGVGGTKFSAEKETSARVYTLSRRYAGIMPQDIKFHISSAPNPFSRACMLIDTPVFLS
jgi:hypothetical protein